MLSDLNVVVWEKRFDQAVDSQTCYCSVDFKILKPTPFDKKWYSHKFRGPGLRYEIGLNIRSGHIVWKYGGFACGDFPDLKIARQAYIHGVNGGERTMADKGYADARYFILPNQNNKRLHKRIMSRHETVNKSIKQFEILKKPFRNNLQKHPMVFAAAVNLTQLMIENGESLFKVL